MTNAKMTEQVRNGRGFIAALDQSGGSTPKALKLYGISESEAYPALLQKQLAADGYAYRVVNAGMSGETSAGALRRIDALHAGGPPRPRSRARTSRRSP